MASLESLPADQRAVLQLVLQRGRSYDEIAAMLSIDRAAVRQRALQGLDSIGPQTRVPPEPRALITDYLLGQLPERVSADVRERLAQSPSERAWARVVASELGPLASKPLPEIPVDGQSRRTPGEEPVRSSIPPIDAALGLADEPQLDDPARHRVVRPDRTTTEPPDAPRSSRKGGAILLGALAALIVVAVIVVIANSGGSSHKNTTPAAAASTSSTAAPATSSTAAAGTATAPTTSTRPQIVSQVNLTSPSSGSKAAGIAEVFKRSGTTGVLIAAQNVPPNTKHDAYAVWLFNSPSDSHILGFVNPGVGSNGRLSTAGALPSNAGHFKQLLVTRETARNPSRPGPVILQGALTGLA